jgi:two-component system response regulator RegA
MNEAARTVLVVDDDEPFRRLLARALQGRGFEVRSASSGEEGLALAQRESPEYAVVDLRMGGMSGLDLVRELRAIDPGTRVVVLTGYGSIATALQAMHLGAVHYLTKPCETSALVAALEHGVASGAGEGPEVPSLARVEWEHIQRVLADCEDNISEAARRLGIHRRSLQRKLAKPVRR